MARRIDEYPDVVIHEIAKRLDYATMLALKLTNRLLHAALSDSLLWINLCERDGCVLPSKEFRKSLKEQAENSDDEACVGQLDFERIWVKNPFRDNLVPPMLVDQDDMEQKYGWTLSWVTVEKPPIGSEPHPDIDRCFATSHYVGKKLVAINLVKEGVPEWLLDHVRPRIVVSEMAAPRWDCASEYQMYAQLLRSGESFDIRARFRNKEVKKEWPQWTRPALWERVEVVFEDYPAGMREIAVMSRGHDRQFWAGNYGSKFANLQVRIEMPEEARWLSESDFSDPIRKRPLSGSPEGMMKRARRDSDDSEDSDDSDHSEDSEDSGDF